ncbi:LolA family protein [Phaeacidiphilus oryzae]|uniref:LolA family protein n=1 Tax=Phaeacidiphilus oryzae TaxID=348818 RepID=UPI000A0633D9|nr:hypothetical protein [Phaeacidiphilus oryzae]
MLLPAGVAAVGIVGVGLVPALAASASPSLPTLTPQQLVAKVMAAKQQTLSGTVQSSSDLGVPAQILDQLPSSAASGSGGGLSPRAAMTALLSGTHTFQVAVDGPAHRAKLVAPDLPGGQEVLVRNGSQAWVYDGAKNTATHLTGLSTKSDPADRTAAGLAGMTPQQAADKALRQLGPTTDVSVAGATRVAGRNAYQLVLKPKGAGSTVSEVRIAVDAATFTPLQVQADSTDGGDPIVDVRFTTVDFGTPAAAAFDYAPPKGAKVVTHDASAGVQPNHKGALTPGQKKALHLKGVPGRPGAAGSGAAGLPGLSGGSERTIGSGWTTVVEFTAPKAAKSGSAHTGSSSAPSALGGLGSLKSLGKSVPGGTLFSTRVVNVLIADNGTVYAGAVTPTVLEHDAGH